MGKTKTAFIGDELSEPKKKSRKQEQSVPAEAEETKQTKARPQKVRGKKYTSAKANIDRNKLYPVADAIELVVKSSYSSFAGTVELHLTVRKEGISARATLPHSTGSGKKIEFADEKTIKKLEAGKVDFDILLATADMMPKLVPFARILGPKGLMPNPKTGTLVKSAKDAEKFNTNTVTIKTEKKAPLVHVVIGKTDMKASALTENAETVMNALQKKQILKAYVCASMSPSVKIDLN
ncbi:hypothetical protein C4564_05190 [Candidatus Microgenomates bacterium]|nr:MAG: hypothetical protein C4564_05190 [Candidatus Microgenomates bacterium]